MIDREVVHKRGNHDRLFVKYDQPFIGYIGRKNEQCDQGKLWSSDGKLWSTKKVVPYLLALLLWNFHNFKTTVKFPKIPGLNFMEISRKFKGVFFVINNWQTRVSFREFQEISEVFLKLFSIFHLSKIYRIVKYGLENLSFMECFNVPHNPERCQCLESK